MRLFPGTQGIRLKSLCKFFVKKSALFTCAARSRLTTLRTFQAAPHLLSFRQPVPLRMEQTSASHHQRIMKKLFLCLLAAGLVAAPLARASDSRDELAAHLRNCEAILRDFQSDSDTAIPPSVLASAHALVIVHQIKASFLLGFQGG